MKRTYRVVVAKPGLDGHDRGAKTITRALRDHGFEVIYTGLHQTPEQIAETALQEDVDAVGLSLLSGAHLTLFPRVMEELRTRDLAEVMVFGGDDAAAEHDDVLGVLGLEEVEHPLEQGQVGTGEDGHADRVSILGDRRVDDLLGGLVQTGVDDLHARVPQSACDDLGASVVAIKARLGDDYPNRCVVFHMVRLMRGATVTSVRGRLPRAPARTTPFP